MSQPSFKDELKADMILADQYANATELRWAARIYRQLARSLGASLGGSDDWPERVGGAIHAAMKRGSGSPGDRTP